MSLAQRLLLALAIAVAGFAAGWYERGIHQQAAQERQATFDLASVQHQVAEQSRQLQRKLGDQQAASIELLIAQRRMRDAGANLRLEIRHASFTSSTPSCPDPMDSPEFYRLYNAAAAGASRPSASGSADSR